MYANFVVRTALPVAGLVPELEAKVRRLDPELVFVQTGTLHELAEVRLFPVRAGAWLIGLFGLLALVVASVGLYARDDVLAVLLTGSRAGGRLAWGDHMSDWDVILYVEDAEALRRRRLARRAR